LAPSFSAEYFRRSATRYDRTRHPLPHPHPSRRSNHLEAPNVDHLEAPNVDSASRDRTHQLHLALGESPG